MEMRLFIRNVVIFIGNIFLSICVIIVLDYLFVGNQFEQGYQASLIDKVSRLESINEPKIILVGNSNVAFGIRSEIIERELNMPAVNLGLHAGLGNRFHENIAKLNINEGDIVVLCHTYYGDYNKIGDAELAITALEWNKELWKILEPADYIEVIRVLPNYILNAFVRKVTKKGNIPGRDCYSRNAFNEYGDNVFADSNDLSKRYIFKPGELDGYVPSVGESCVERINEFDEYIKSRGATLVIGGFPIADGEYTPNHCKYDDFEKKLRENVSCPVIFTCDNYYFDYDYFYDTVYHLTKEGAELRTYRLIEDLKCYFSGNDFK